MPVVLSFFVFFALSLCLLTPAKAEQSVRAYVGEFSPFIISEGKYEGQGTVDKVVAFFEAKMKGYQFDRIPASFKRGMEDMKNGRAQGCTFALLKNAQREEYLDFSEPYLLLADVGLVVHKKHKNVFNRYINDAGDLDLKSALADRVFTLHFYKDRSYSPYINEVIKEEVASSSPNILRSTKDDWIMRGFRTISKEEVFGFILYPEEAEYVSSGFGLEKEIAFIRIKNGRGFSKTHIACTKGGWNDAFMAELDKQIIKYRNKDDVLKHHYRWMAEDAKMAHQKEINLVWPK